jgi:hypothetical protein
MKFIHRRSVEVLFSALLIVGLSLHAQANAVSINAEGVLVIDGKKVFPIGFTVAPSPDGKTPTGKNAIAELADAGATFLRAGPLGGKWDEDCFVAEKRMHDAAAKYGMHCWLYLRDVAAIKNERQEALLRKIVTTFKDHPGLGCYKGADEPEWGRAPLPPLERTYTVLKELDLQRPLVIIQAPRGTMESLKRYNPICDITGFDVYPIAYPPGKHSQFNATNSEMSMIGDYTKRAVELSEGRKGVWMTLQLAWSGVLNKGKTLRFPTFPEERFMTYQAVINGARGLTYFGGAIPSGMTAEDKKLGWNWRFWNRVLRPVVEEIGTKSPLYPALLEPDSKLPVKVKGAGIEFCVREVGNEVFVLACKRDHTTEQVEFSGLPPTRGVGDVLFEEPRTVEIKNGRFTDWFAPFEVHVYRFARAK